jgi:transcriptional regulator with GAF, ATPase, and Fis domain
MQRKNGMTETGTGAAREGEAADVEAGHRQDLARTFVELADTMVADFDLLDFLHVLADRSVSLLGADAAGLMLADQRGQLRVLASTSEETRVLELFELQNAEGPCLDCFHSGDQVVNVDSASARDRWPFFTREAVAAGFESVHALPLRLRGTVIGTINLFCLERARLSAEDVDVGQALADVATIGLLSQGCRPHSQFIAETLQEAVNSRTLIEQAKGILAEVLTIDMNQGFYLIRHHAHRHNEKLTRIARGIVDGSIPAGALNEDA